MHRTLANLIIEVWNINLATGLVVIKLNQYHFYSLYGSNTIVNINFRLEVLMNHSQPNLFLIPILWR